MSFNGTEGSSIPVADAAAMTSAYRVANPGAVKAVFFGKDILNSILAQSNCMGIRMYFAIGGDYGGNTLVLVGADSSENDQIGGIVADKGVPCPTYCSSSNALNS